MAKGKKGRCVICAVTGKLTEDHVPPKSVARPTEIEIRSLANSFGTGEDTYRPGFQAPTFVTLCERCNSTLLGQEYDPALGHFCNALGSWVRGRFESGLFLGDWAVVPSQVNRVLRAVVGHLLAADRRSQVWAELDDVPMINAMRAYFLDPLATLGPEISVFCWPYPSGQQVILRGFIRKDWFFKNTVDPILGDLIKFYPVAFWLTWENREVEVQLPDIARLATANPDDWVDVPLSMSRVPHVNWPETPGDDTILLVDQTKGTFAKAARRGKGRRSRTI